MNDLSARQIRIIASAILPFLLFFVIQHVYFCRLTPKAVCHDLLIAMRDRDEQSIIRLSTTEGLTSLVQYNPYGQYNCLDKCQTLASRALIDHKSRWFSSVADKQCCLTGHQNQLVVLRFSKTSEGWKLEDVLGPAFSLCMLHDVIGSKMKLSESSL